MAQHARRLLLGPGLWVGSGIAAIAYAAPSVMAEKDEKAASEKATKAEREKSDRLFDPEALERGAKALREINKSPYAKQVRRVAWLSAAPASGGRHADPSRPQNALPARRAPHPVEVAPPSIDQKNAPNGP
ncbi:hypothetical protein TSOC_001243 [Tetrabaena socialis]|uniref:ATPase family AAA domain-containing protein n=1 Tax=Tetrabaena socialis TaxID=47790 RepID=A0A2J8AHD9_9CHLO|nr:hypothetical protein TSOC_001243 [Tetrabaena socialis]|eukprot:PNH11928.1 hypothetical protein TSOC_001243 [Tetrabaena socialis]